MTSGLIEAGGFYQGICTNNADPEGFYRIKATCPQAFGDVTTETDWAWPVMPVGYARLVVFSGGRDGVENTLYPVPVPGTVVWISFVGDDIEHAVWQGVLR
jgi:hypothetical protein